MGDDRIDTVISHIDMGYLVTLPAATAAADMATVTPRLARGVMRATCRHHSGTIKYCPSCCWCKATSRWRQPSTRLGSKRFRV